MSNFTAKTFTTDKQLANAKPKKDRYELADVGCQGLRVRIRPSGKKMFVWYARDADKKRHVITLGEYPAVSLAEARTKLGKLKKKQIQGTLFNTGEAPKTVAELCADFFAERIVPHRTRPDVVKQIIGHDILPSIGKLKLDMITPLDINAMIRTVSKRAPTHAGKVLAIVKQMFAYAEGLGYIDRSPAYAQKPKDLGIVINTPRDRYLNSEEIALFWDALDKAPRMSDPVRTAFRILLLSGVRSGELRLAKWEHIDFDKRTWFVPEENSKTRAWTIPLSSHLIKQFRALQALSGGSEWVIAGKNGPVTDKVFGRAMKRLFEQGILEIDPATPHDLRRTLRSHLDDLDVDPHISEKCLNHSLGKIAETYNKNQMLPQRMEALEKWGDFVDLVVNPRENVTRLQA